MVKLRTLVLAEDSDSIFALYADHHMQTLFSNLIQIKSKEDFLDWFHFQLLNRFHEFRVVEKDGCFAGFCYSYEFQPDGTVKTAVCICPQYMDSGIGAMAELLFLDELFIRYPLRKVYNYVYAYNERSLKTNLDGGFETEGLLKEYRYLNGEYHDLYILALSRTRFYDLHGHLIETIRRHHCENSADV